MNFIMANIIQKIKACPVCYLEFSTAPGSTVRDCDNGCGGFSLRAVNTDGSADLTFRMRDAAETEG